MYDDDLDDELDLAAMEAEDSAAREVLLEALPGIGEAIPPLPELQAAVSRIRAGVASGEWPYRYFIQAVPWEPGPPLDDTECYFDALWSLMDPVFDEDYDDWSIEELASVQALEHADWAGSVIGLVRAGAGASAAPDALLKYIDACPELEGERDPGDDVVIQQAFEVQAPLWQALGITDSDRRVTRLGLWALPRLLLEKWYVEPGPAKA
jgi:hypothetical protein